VNITREEARNMAEAHAEGYHTPPEGLPREGCPECEDRPLRDYPPSGEYAEPVRRYRRTANPHIAAIDFCGKDDPSSDPGHYVPAGQTDPA